MTHLALPLPQLYIRLPCCFFFLALRDFHLHSLLHPRPRNGPQHGRRNRTMAELPIAIPRCSFGCSLQLPTLTTFANVLQTQSPPTRSTHEIQLGSNRRIATLTFSINDAAPPVAPRKIPKQQQEPAWLAIVRCLLWNILGFVGLLLLVGAETILLYHGTIWVHGWWYGK